MGKPVLNIDGGSRWLFIIQSQCQAKVLSPGHKANSTATRKDAKHLPIQRERG